jgi:hypothetical protein
VPYGQVRVTDNAANLIIGRARVPRTVRMTSIRLGGTHQNKGDF